jgi:glycolate oxidase
VFPHTTAEVAAVVKVAEAHDVPIIARGAGTGLAAGAIPVNGGIVLSTTSMNQIELDVENRTAWVGAGVINLDLSKEAASHGLTFAPDPSSQSACTIGGNVANNSGGAHCLAEGATTSHVLGLEVVLAGGEVHILGGQAPDMPGLDLKGLIVGSEGTLGVVTRALVRLLPIESDVRTLLLDFEKLAGATKTVSDVIAAGLVPAALEIMDQKMTTAVENWLRAGLPCDCAAILLAEVVGEPEAVEAEAALISGIGKENGARNVRWQGTRQSGPSCGRDGSLPSVPSPRCPLTTTCMTRWCRAPDWSRPWRRFRPSPIGTASTSTTSSMPVTGICIL